MDTTSFSLHNQFFAYAYTERRTYISHTKWYNTSLIEALTQDVLMIYKYQLINGGALTQNRKAKRALCFLAVILGLLYPAHLRAQEPLVKNGDNIAFMGDSITYYGAGTPSGYVRLVISGLEGNGIKATAIPAGIGGQVSSQMLARVDHDIVSKKPAWMTLSCGVNDVWHGATGVPLDQYKVNMTAIVDKAQAAGIQVMILTATMIYEDQTNATNQKLIGYNESCAPWPRRKSACWPISTPICRPPSKPGRALRIQEISLPLTESI